MQIIDLPVLKALALAALPGEWTVGETYAGDDGQPETVVRGMGGMAGISVCLDFGPNNPHLRDAHAAYIAAANPAAVLALISALEEAYKRPRAATGAA